MALKLQKKCNVEGIKNFNTFSCYFTIFLFSIKYYFSDQFKKKVYRSYNNHEIKIIEYSNNLKLIKSDTENIIQYNDSNTNSKKKIINFGN